MIEPPEYAYAGTIIVFTAIKHKKDRRQTCSRQSGKMKKALLFFGGFDMMDLPKRAAADNRSSDCPSALTPMRKTDPCGGAK